MLKKIKIKNDNFYITNQVYIEEVNISKEYARYKKIKSTFNDFSNYQTYIYFGLVFEKPNNNSFLRTITENNKYLKFFNLDQIKEYNNKVRKIQNLKIKDKTINVIEKFENNILELKYKKIYFKLYLPWYEIKYKERIFCCLLRYDILGFLNNMSTAVLPQIYEQRKKEGYFIELFGSFFNHYLPYYFGLFYDLEKPFGCLGNFFSCQLKYGKFVSNPPFDRPLMNIFFTTIERFLRKNKITIFITIPLWYVPYRIEFNKMHKEQLLNDYENDLRQDLIEKYVIYKKYFSKTEYKFINYLLNKLINICPVVELIVSSMKN